MPLELPLPGKTFTNEQKWLCAISPTTMAGAPAPVEPASLSVTVVSGDGTAEMIDDTTFWIISGANPGDTSYIVSADADVGSGVSLIQDTIVAHVVGAMATNLGMSAATDPVTK